MDEMPHADRFIRRIRCLDALPNLQELDRLRIDENVREIVENDLAAEKERPSPCTARRRARARKRGTMPAVTCSSSGSGTRKATTTSGTRRST